MAADLTASNTELGIAEDEGCNDIEESHQGRHDSSCNDHAPHWQTQILHAGSTLVEIAQNVKTQHDHGHAEEDETAFGTEHGPVAREVRAEERAFGYDEEETNGTCDEVRYSVEEKEIGCFDGHNKHDPASNNDQKE